ncbi:MAG: hypothetical protein KDD89_13165, partial [Anaerolineales bacterium]|nr:hypothetical protein [Anaerolineales bacterium]
MITYTLEAFGGASSTVVPDPTDAANNVAQFVKPAGAQTWAGVTVATEPGFSVPALPFTASDTTMTVRFWSPDAGTPVLLKVEDAADGGKFVEVLVNTTVAGDWETLTFDFANPTNGSLNLAYTYNKISIFPNFGNTGVEKTYYFDDVAFDGGGTPPPPTDPVVAFDNSQFSVVEGETATVSVSLNMTSTNTITVSYATMDDTAVAGTHYTATTGTLTFAPGSQTQTFTVDTIDNSQVDGNKSLDLILSDPISATLGGRSTATLLIQDNEAPPAGGKGDIIDDFENGLPYGEDGDGNGIGFVVWGDDWNGTTVNITTTLVGENDPIALPGQGGDTHVLQFDANVNGWGGLTHAFANEALDTWVPQDWSSFEGICFWIYGQNTGNDLLFEINENRNPGSTTADTEIWSHGFKDDFSGWRLMMLNFDEDFTRKEIGNGAPNDGFTREQVHGWAFGSLATGGADVTYYLDDVMVYGNTGTDRPLAIAFDLGKVDINEGNTAELVVELSREHDQTVTVDYATA